MDNLPEPLQPEAVYRAVDASSLGFKTTADAKPLLDGLGQPRAIDAIAFGTGIPHGGYNLFAFGEPGTGRHTLIRTYLEERATKLPAPDDWCYVNNFVDGQKPEAISLPSG